MLFPVQKDFLKECRYSSPYGMRWGRKHRGIDIAMPIGTPLVAIEDGVVLYNKVNGGGSSKGYGFYIVVKHDNGLYSLFGHLKELSPFKVGTRVNKGQIIALSGNSGNTTGPHVHFEIQEKEFLFRSQVQNIDSAIDPVKYYCILEDYKGNNLEKYGNIKHHDENVSMYAIEARNWVMENNISDGLRAKDSITREEVWTMLFRNNKKGEM